MKYFALLTILASAAMISAQVSPTHPFPDDPEELDRVTCGKNTDHNCLYIVNSQIKTVFENPQDAYKTVTRANGEQIIVTGAGAKGHFEAHCLGGEASSQINFTFDRTSGNQVDYVRGIMNAQYKSNWDRVVSKQNPNVLSTTNGDDLRVYCTRIA